MYLEKKDLPSQLRHLVCPGHIRVTLAETVSIPADAGTWSGGTRQLFSAVELASGRAVSITDVFSAPWDGSRSARSITLKPGYAIVEMGSFCGKPSGLHLYALPSDLAPLLPAPTPLTVTQWNVLDVICGLKSAYREDEYRHRNLSTSYVAQAKLDLALQGLIDSRGAVTVKGRNARADSRNRP